MQTSKSQSHSQSSSSSLYNGADSISHHEWISRRVSRKPCSKQWTATSDKNSAVQMIKTGRSYTVLYNKLTFCVLSIRSCLKQQVLFKRQPLCPARFYIYANDDDDVHDDEHTSQSHVLFKRQPLCSAYFYFYANKWQQCWWWWWTGRSHLWTHGNGYGVSKHVDALQHRSPRLGAEPNVLCVVPPLLLADGQYGRLRPQDELHDMWGDQWASAMHCCWQHNTETTH